MVLVLFLLALLPRDTSSDSCTLTPQRCGKTIERVVLGLPDDRANGAHSVGTACLGLDASKGPKQTPRVYLIFGSSSNRGRLTLEASYPESISLSQVRPGV